MSSIHPIAAIDLGSNSFHLVVAEPRPGHLKVLDRLREVTRLGAGLGADGRLTPAATARALECLQRFGERVRHLAPGTVRVVGTSALRRARDAEQFLRRAERLLGHPIDIVSGIEEARLIHLGIAHGLAEREGPRLVMDIGGGSTELIIGCRHEPRIMESLNIGCVSMTERFFADGRIDAKRLRAAELGAGQEFEPVEELFRRHGWHAAIGSSGTLLAVAEALTRLQFSPEGITRPGLRKLRAAILELDHVSELARLGVRDDRRPVFPGGLAVVLAAFEELGIEHMQVSTSGLREGLLYDLVGRIEHEDVREHTVEALSRRFQVDEAQAARVVATAETLHRGIAGDWALDEPDQRQLLRWAARLHEIGASIAHSQYQKHGAYLLQYLDMPGFSRGEQRRLGFLVRAHRRKFPHAELALLPEPERESCLRLAVILRLAVVLHRARRPAALSVMNLAVRGNQIRLGLPARWLEGHALVAADLEEEAAYLRSAGFKLRLSGADGLRASRTGPGQQ